MHRADTGARPPYPGGERRSGTRLMLELQFYLVSGLVVAAIWALPAAGVSLIYGVLRYPNFAIAEYGTLGAYLALAISAQGLSLAAAAIVAAVVTGAVAVAADQAVFRPVRGAGPVPPILLSLGLMLILQNIVRFVWGNEVQQYDVPLQAPWRVFGFVVSPPQAVTLAVATGLLLLLHVLLRRTGFGRDTRAVANNRDLAITTGVEPERVYGGITFITGALAALGGIMLGLAGSITPLMGWHSLIPIFAVAILGGLGNVLGTLVAAAVLGVASEFSLFLVEASYKPAIAFVVLVAVLTLRPGGILKGEY